MSTKFSLECLWLGACRQLLGPFEPGVREHCAGLEPDMTELTRCPCCGQGTMRRAMVLHPQRGQARRWCSRGLVRKLHMPPDLTSRYRVGSWTARGRNVPAGGFGLLRRCRLAPGCPIDPSVGDTDGLVSHLPGPDEMDPPPSAPRPRLHSLTGTPGFSP